MATIFSHPAVPVAIALALGNKTIPRPLLIAGIISSILPDADCIGFAFHIPYASQFGHRGATHSIVFALLVAAVWAWQHKDMQAKPLLVFAYTFIACISHPLIDAMTDGGLGVAFFWPFSAERYFFPLNPIPVSPIGAHFFSARGLEVFLTELGMLWLPAFVIGGAGFILRKFVKKEKAA